MKEVWRNCAFLIYAISLMNLIRLISGFKLTLLHTNDVHARFEEVNKYGGPCHERDALAKKCYGGIARRKTAVDTIRSLSENVLFLDAGDQFQGTLWFYIHKGEAAAYFMNQLGYDAMALGNHEFDNGIDGLMPFLKKANFTVLSSNIDFSQEPQVASFVVSSKVFHYGRTRVGVIGYTSSETPELSSPGKLEFRDEIEMVRKEAQMLQAEGIEILIAVGHAGYQKDVQIAQSVEGLDIVVGGHTNTLLFNGEPLIGKSIGEYPTVITQYSGHKVLVVQSYAFGIYLGYLDVSFSENGDLLSWSGDPRLLDRNVPEDSAMLAEMEHWHSRVDQMNDKAIGSTEVFLDGSKEACRLGECNMGNVIADALLYHFTNDLMDSFMHANAAIINGGSIRSSLEIGDITMGDLQTVQPFRNTIDLVELRGEHLKEVLEHSVSGDLAEKHGRFLQVAGLKVRIDLKQPDGKRITGVCVRDTSGDYRPLNNDAVYRIVVPSFVIGGGDGYDMIKEFAVRHEIFESLDVELTMEYISEHSPVNTEQEGRLQFISEVDQKEQRILPCDTYTIIVASSSSSPAFYPQVIIYFITALIIPLFKPRG